MPSGIVTTAWPSVKRECLRLGITFDPWQDGAGTIIFGKRADGTYACSIGGAVLSIPRQVGKTFLIGSIAFALCMLNPGMLVIWTAHQLATAGETFRDMQAMAKRSKVWPYVKQIRLGSGDEAIEFTNGSRILFGARERGFGLGFTKVGVLVLDEAQRVTEKTMDDLIPTMNQAENPLLFMVGTPPRPTDTSEEFKRRRREALEVKAAAARGETVESDAVYVEFSADGTVHPTAWSHGHVDWEAVAKANPSYPHRTPKSAVLRMLKNLRPESFRREGLGIWDEDQEGSRLVSAELWGARGVDKPLRTGKKALAVAFSADGERLSVAGAFHDDGRTHGEVIDALDGGVDAGLTPLADWIVAKVDGVPRWKSYSAIVLSGRAGAGVLAQLLRDRKVRDRALILPTTPQYFQACATAFDAIRDGTATHLNTEGQSALDDSVSVCDKKKRGTDGSWSWTPTTVDGDETPIEAYSLALWAARTTKRAPRGDTERRKAVIL